MSNVVSGDVQTLVNAHKISAKTVGGSARPEVMEEMDRELTKVIEDFDRAVNVEALCETSKLSISQNVDS